MASVFATQQTFAGGFRADLLRMTIGGVPLRGLVIQSVNFQYGQQVSMLYEVGSDNVYFVGGRAQGNAGLQSVAGPSALASQLLTLFRDLCTPQSLAMSGSGGCASVGGRGGNSLNITLQDAVMVGISGQVNAQDSIINQTMQLMFINMDIPGTAASRNTGPFQIPLAT